MALGLIRELHGKTMVAQIVDCLGRSINVEIGWGSREHGMNAAKADDLDVGVGRPRQLNSDIGLEAQDIG